LRSIPRLRPHATNARSYLQPLTDVALDRVSIGPQCASGCSNNGDCTAGACTCDAGFSPASGAAPCRSGPPLPNAIVKDFFEVALLRCVQVWSALTHAGQGPVQPWLPNGPTPSIWADTSFGVVRSAECDSLRAGASLVFNGEASPLH
jgi:hypothetical protein